MKIVIDAMGGDYSPSEIVKGCVLTLQKYPNLELVLVGRQDLINLELQNLNYTGDRIDIVHAEDVISCNEAPVEAVRTKTESSIVKALEFLKNSEDTCGMVSAGSTGAFLTGAFLKLGRMTGVKRPALSPLFPTINGKECIVVDAGANMDCNEINLVQFALMGNAFMKSVKKMKNPRVALLSVGAEDQKGNDLVKKAFPLLREQDINFVGNVEARDVLSGDYDVIVCDGFAGNVLTKSIEGTVNFTMKLVKKSILKSFIRRIGSLFMKGAFKELKATFGSSSIGGAPFLGVNKLIVKAHGNSKAINIQVAIEQVINFANADLIANIKSSIEGK